MSDSESVDQTFPNPSGPEPLHQLESFWEVPTANDPTRRVQAGPAIRNTQDAISIREDDAGRSLDINNSGHAGELVTVASTAPKALYGEHVIKFTVSVDYFLERRGIPIFKLRTVKRLLTRSKRKRAVQKNVRNTTKPNIDAATVSAGGEGAENNTSMGADTANEGDQNDGERFRIFYLTYRIGNRYIGSSSILMWDNSTWSITQDVRVDNEFILDLYERAVEVTLWEIVPTEEDQNSSPLSKRAKHKQSLKAEKTPTRSTKTVDARTTTGESINQDAVSETTVSNAGQHRQQSRLWRRRGVGKSNHAMHGFRSGCNIRLFGRLSKDRRFSAMQALLKRQLELNGISEAASHPVAKVAVNQTRPDNAPPVEGKKSIKDSADAQDGNNENNGNMDIHALWLPASATVEKKVEWPNSVMEKEGLDQTLSLQVIGATPLSDARSNRSDAANVSNADDDDGHVHQKEESEVVEAVEAVENNVGVEDMIMKDSVDVHGVDASVMDMTSEPPKQTDDHSANQAGESKSPREETEADKAKEKPTVADPLVDEPLENPNRAESQNNKDPETSGATESEKNERNAAVQETPAVETFEELGASASDSPVVSAPKSPPNNESEYVSAGPVKSDPSPSTEKDHEGERNTVPRINIDPPMPENKFTPRENKAKDVAVTHSSRAQPLNDVLQPQPAHGREHLPVRTRHASDNPTGLTGVKSKAIKRDPVPVDNTAKKDGLIPSSSQQIMNHYTIDGHANSFPASHALRILADMSGEQNQQRIPQFQDSRRLPERLGKYLFAGEHGDMHYILQNDDSEFLSAFRPMSKLPPAPHHYDHPERHVNSAFGLIFGRGSTQGPHKHTKSVANPKAPTEPSEYGVGMLKSANKMYRSRSSLSLISAATLARSKTPPAPHHHELPLDTIFPRDRRSTKNGATSDTDWNDTSNRKKKSTKPRRAHDNESVASSRSSLLTAAYEIKDGKSTKRTRAHASEKTADERRVHSERATANAATKASKAGPSMKVKSKKMKEQESTAPPERVTGSKKKIEQQEKASALGSAIDGKRTSSRDQINTKVDKPTKHVQPADIPEYLRSDIGGALRYVDMRQKDDTLSRTRLQWRDDVAGTDLIDEDGRSTIASLRRQQHHSKRGKQKGRSRSNRGWRSGSTIPPRSIESDRERDVTRAADDDFTTFTSVAGRIPLSFLSSNVNEDHEYILDEIRKRIQRELAPGNNNLKHVVVGKVFIDVSKLFLGDVTAQGMLETNVDGVESFHAMVNIDSPLLSLKQKQRYVNQSSQAVRCPKRLPQSKQQLIYLFSNLVRSLNPMAIRILAADDMPDKPISYQELQLRCMPV
ncbi:hypothetical protein HK102_010133 [Quaeritorhiza haematococci]|nr:hypothetical protein HK102_010133 [Quaeritorhiza haematococci]